MPLTSVADLVDTLRKSRLLEAGQLDEIRDQLQPRTSDPRALAHELIKRDWLTPYQVNQLFQDRGQDLVLGQYVLLERLGEGGMGQVFKARHRSLGRTVALKVVRKERLANPTVVRRFEREIRVAAQLKHPNVVLAFDADMIGNNYFIAMEYVEGVDLSRLVKVSGPLPVEQACDFIAQAALGLQHAHERGLVHRDVKPANLLVTRPAGKAPAAMPLDPPSSASGVLRGPVVKILDLGLARLHPAMEDEGVAGVTQEGVVVGTVDYLAPEQAVNSSTVDVRADIYGLGCSFYFLLTGQVPFVGTTAMEKLLKHRCEEPPPVEHLRPEVSPSLAAVVRKMMAKRPEDRYQTPAEVANALTTLVSKGGLAKTLAVPAGDGGAIPRAIPVVAGAGGALTKPPQAIPVPRGDTAPDWETLAFPPLVVTNGAPRPARGKPSWLVRYGLGLGLIAAVGALLYWLLSK